MTNIDDSLNNTTDKISDDTFNLSLFQVSNYSLLDSVDITHQMAEQLEIQLKQMNKLFTSLKIPDVIKDLPEFHGDKDTLHEFISNVDEIIDLCKELLTEDQEIPTAFLRAIRNKIKGQANKDIFNYGTFTTWDKLKVDLITHYSDKRSEVSLIRDLHSTLQGINSTEVYYTNVLKVQTALINQVRLKENDVKVKEKLYKEMCLSQFLANLREPLGSIIRSRDPKTLPEAFEFCTTEENMYYQKNRLSIRPQYNWPNNLNIPQIRQTNYQFRQNYQVRPPIQNNVNPTSNNWHYIPQRYQLPPQNYQFHPQNYQLPPQNFTRQPISQNFKQLTYNPPVITDSNIKKEKFAPHNYQNRQIKQEKDTKLYNTEITEISNESDLEIKPDEEIYEAPHDNEENIQHEYYCNNEEFFLQEASE